MREIRISPGTQMVLLAAILAAVAAVLAAQAPELQRYLKIRQM
jgi:hypothetical protein